MKNTTLKIDCKTCRTLLADLLLDDAYAASHLELASHLAACSDCSQELAELQATLAMMDSWAAPEPSAYFDAKVHVGLRELQAAAPEGVIGRLRAFLMFSTGRHLRPMMAGALAVVMLAGGGGVLLSVYPHTHAVPASATVNDLKILDNNAQALQDMDQLLDDSGSNGDDASGPPLS